MFFAEKGVNEWSTPRPPDTPVTTLYRHSSRHVILLPRTEGSRLEKLIIEGEAELGVLAHCLHTSAYVSIRTHTPAYVSKVRPSSAFLPTACGMSAYVTTPLPAAS